MKKPNIVFFRIPKSDQFIEISISDKGIGLETDKVFTVPTDDSYLGLNDSQIILAHLENLTSEMLAPYTIAENGNDTTVYDLYFKDRKTFCDKVIGHILANYLSGDTTLEPWQVT